NGPLPQRKPLGVSSTQGQREKRAMVATPSIQSSAPSISLATLREALADLKAQEPERGIRWDRAACIVALRTIQPGYTAGTWVESECEAGKWYWVLQVPSGNWTCICPDYQQRGGPCKHALAVRVFEACEAKEAAREAASQPCAACGQPDRLTAGLCEPCIRREAAHDPDAPIPFELTPQAIAALDSGAGPSRSHSASRGQTEASGEAVLAQPEPTFGSV